MVPKRKRDHADTGPIIYGIDAPWLQVLTREPICQLTSEDSDHGKRDPTLASFGDEEVVWEASKMTYLLYHNLNANDSQSKILRSIGIAPDTYPEKAWAKKLSQKQTQWKAAIIKSLLMHVQELIRKWLVANPWRTFASLSEEERAKTWMEAYDVEPERIATSMFKPVISVLDVSNIFNSCLTSEDDKAKTKAVRVMLRNKYLFGCELVYKNRVREGRGKREVSSDEWAAYADDEILAPTIVAVADIPIFSKLLSQEPTPQSKRAKTAQGVSVDTSRSDAGETM